jgi:hypothetical protein
MVDSHPVASPCIVPALPNVLVRMLAIPVSKSIEIVKFENKATSK